MVDSSIQFPAQLKGQINGVKPLSHLGILQIKGDDAKSFLQGQITCNLDEITLEQSRLAGHCNLKGRLQSFFRIVKVNEGEYYLTMPLDMVPIALQNFKKFAMFSKVTLKNITSELFYVGTISSENTMPVDGCETHFIDENFYTICRVPSIPGKAARYEIFGNMDVKWDHNLDLDIDRDWDWELEDIKAGIPAIYPNTVDLFLAHHLNLSEFNSISYNKGCYLGQEIIARMHYKGNIKKHMYHGIIEEGNTEVPTPGTPVFAKSMSDNDAPGNVVRATQSDCLLVIDDQYIDDHLTLDSKEGIPVNVQAKSKI